MNIIDPELEKKLKVVEALERKKQLQRCLPHLYGFKLYKWQHDFIESSERVNLLCASNQIGKSSCNKIKEIKIATNPECWPKFFPVRTPKVFWYLLPTKDLITTEYKSKWVPEFLPREEFKDHPQYGWEEEWRNRHLWAIHYKTGISCYMHTYEQDVHHLQAGTVDAMFVDEEVPWELMPELLMRMTAVNGMFNAVMTPTRGQDQWRRAFEIRGEGEVFQGAFKQQVTMFDCKYHMDGTASRWTDERINRVINQLGTQQEIDLRVYGKFVAQEGLMVPAFDRSRHVKPPLGTPMHDWLWYSGVDIGSGGSGHPPAIVFVAVRPDYQYARIEVVWKGDKKRNYTATDILDKYVELRGGKVMAGEYYDFASAEFGIVAQRAGEGFQKAEKGHDIGFTTLNAVFKNDMLHLTMTDWSDLLLVQLITIRHDHSKKSRHEDDLIDALRYAVSKIPFNFENVTGIRTIKLPRKVETPDEERRRMARYQEPEITSIEDEISAWNEVLNADFEEW